MLVWPSNCCPRSAEGYDHARGGTAGLGDRRGSAGLIRFPRSWAEFRLVCLFTGAHVSAGGSMCGRGYVVPLFHLLRSWTCHPLDLATLGRASQVEVRALLDRIMLLKGQSV